VVLLCVLLGAAAAMLVAPSKPTYQADALVVARHLAVSPNVLPNLAESVFADGAVTAAVAKDPAVHGDVAGLIPDVLTVVPQQNSIVVDVQARDTDPAAAARLANTAATAFTDELNRGGAGVGQFEVQAQATLPATPLGQFSQKVRAALGALAGLFVGFGVVALIGVTRRPVVTSRDVESTLGLPMLGTVELHRTARGAYLGPRGIRGIATVTRWLAASPARRLMLISSRSGVGMRRRLYVMLGVALSGIRPMRFEAPEELVSAIRQHAIQQVRPGGPGSRVPEGAGEMVLVDGGSPLDITDPAVDDVSVVAVAPRGISRRRLRNLAAEYMDGCLVGAVLVQRRAGRGSSLRAVRPAPSVPATDSRVPAARSVPEPERA
jgi:capsular polysaccharide biosynthesis protein